MLKHRDTWADTHHGIAYKIVAWGENVDKTGPIWNYYVYINSRSVPYEHHDQFFLDGTWSRIGNEDTPLRYWYSYADSWLAKLPWHGGMTSYNILGRLHGQARIAEAGCDYNHYSDDGNQYTVEKVERDAIKTINVIHEQCPWLRRRCTWSGQWESPTDGTTDRYGQWWSYAGLRIRTEKWPNDKPILGADGTPLHKENTHGQ